MATVHMITSRDADGISGDMDEKILVVVMVRLFISMISDDER